jgi:uncharacterized protein YutE (UPF0331/DUF86 family)
MDGYAFTVELVKAIASMIAAFAWPTSIFLIVWLFRGKLNELLPQLILKHKDWQISFGLAKAEEEAKKLPAASTDPKAQPTLQEKMHLEQLAIQSPRAAILAAGANVDKAVNQFAEAVGLSKSQTPSTTVLSELGRHELIDRNTVALLNELRQIRNAAAHNISEPTVGEAQRFQVLATQLIRQFDIATGAAKMPPPGPIQHNG